LAKQRRSISAFLDDIPKEAESELAIAEITLPASQPRCYFDPNKMAQLAASIEKHGILEPLLVRPSNSSYELVAGERRYRAAIELGLETVPVVVRNLNDHEALAISLIENLQREDLNPVEETEGILSLIAIELDIQQEEVIAKLYKMRNELNGSDNVVTNPEHDTIQSVFRSLGLLSWDSFITHRLPLLKLPDEILEALRQGKLAYTKALAISRIKDEEQRRSLLEASISENLSIRQIKERIAALNPKPEKLPIQKQLDSAYSSLKKSKVWNNPDKKQRLESLLQEIESILKEE
jgi:ParB family chromosome partitioning protein